MSNNQVIIRCDSSYQLGGGHVIRCLSLAEQFAEHNFEVTFICKDLSGHLGATITQSGFKLCLIPQDLSVEKDAEVSLEIISKFCDPIVIVDHYGLNDKWEVHFYLRGLLIAIDDLYSRKHQCHVIIDANFHPDHAKAYKKLVPASAHQFFGPSYALLRKEFRKLEILPQTQRAGVVVFFGSGDPSGESLKFIHAVEKYQPKINFTLIVGASNQYLKDIKAARKLANLKIKIQPMSICEIFLNSELYFGSGGTTTWERMRCGLPGLVVAVAENQEKISYLLGVLEFQTYLGPRDTLDFQKAFEICEQLLSEKLKLKKQQQKGRDLVRPLDVAQILNSRQELRLRLATMEDAQFLYNLRNDPVCFENSINKNKFSFESHCAWLKSKLDELGTSMYVIIIKNKNIGQIRIDPDLTVSIALMPEWRGRGVGALSLKQAIDTDKLKRTDKKNNYIAYVSAKNPQSEKIFLKAGFEKSKVLDGKFKNFYKFEQVIES